MAESFTINTQFRGATAAGEASQRRRVLVTGAAGRIGSYFAEHSHEEYDLRLMVRPTDQGIDKVRPFGEVVEGNLGDLAGLKRHSQNIDTVLHLAASAGPSTPWAEALENNIVGTYHVLAAAKSAGVRRVIFASSIHAVSGYPGDVQVKPSDPVNPGDIYGVSKCFGEALCRYMAEQEGVSAIAIRIGAFQPIEAAQREGSYRMMDAFVSERDLNQLFHRCIDDTTLRFAIFHGLSGNRFQRMDISSARELVGYVPEDDLTRENPRLKDLDLSNKVMDHNLGDGQESGLRNDL